MTIAATPTWQAFLRTEEEGCAGHVGGVEVRVTMSSYVAGHYFVSFLFDVVWQGHVSEL